MSKRPRKRPRPHRVSPTDNRYSDEVKATGYPRGSGGMNPSAQSSPVPFDTRWLDGVSNNDLREIYSNMYRNVYGTNEGLSISAQDTPSAHRYWIKLIYNDAVFNKRMNINMGDYLHGTGKVTKWDGKTDSGSPYHALRQKGVSHKDAVDTIEGRK